MSLVSTIRVKDYPGVLLDVHFGDKGDLDRESFLVKVEGGKQVVTSTLPPVTPIKLIAVIPGWAPDRAQ